MKINFTQLLGSFSLALDLGENRTLSHAKRTAYISFKIGECLGIKHLRELYYAGLLHDIGVTKTLSEEHFLLSRVKNHCDFGSQLVDKLPVPKNTVEIIKYHHENFDGSGPNGLLANQLPLESQIVYLADEIDIRTNQNKTIYSQKDSLIDYITNNKGTKFSPKVVDAFMHVAKKESFWLDIENNHFQWVDEKINDNNPYEDINADELLEIAKVFGKIIDSKSKFTHSHSSGLANVVKEVATQNNLNNIKLLETAALLHDIGKLAVPKEILEKPGSLTQKEFSVIKSHVYYTKYILGSIDGFDEICKIASSHHEKLDGSGYCDRLIKSELSLYDRLLGVCDIYQALTEERPYRRGDEPQKALQIIKEMVDKGLLCCDAYDLLESTKK